jgi:hypothetical protein
MIPTQAVEKFLQSIIAGRSGGVQVLIAKQQAKATLPRIEISATADQDPTLAQAGVFPISVSVVVMAEAREIANIQPLTQLVCDCLSSADSQETRVRTLPGGVLQYFQYSGNDEVAIYGSVLGSVVPQESDDMIMQTVDGVIWAKLKPE